MIPCAVAQNIQTMLIARFLDGIAGSAFLSVAGGTVGDMFAKHVGLSSISNQLTDANQFLGAIIAHDGVYSKPICWA